MNFFGPLLIGISLGINLMNLTIHLSGHTYKDGQIDALNGKIKYEIQKQENGTTEWVYIEK